MTAREMTKEQLLMHEVFSAMRKMGAYYGKDLDELDYDIVGAIEREDFETLYGIIRELEDRFDIPNGKEFLFNYEIAKKLKVRPWGKIHLVKIRANREEMINRL